MFELECEHMEQCSGGKFIKNIKDIEYFSFLIKQLQLSYNPVLRLGVKILLKSFVFGINRNF